MENYKKLILEILNKGIKSKDEFGNDFYTLSEFSLEFDLSETWPALELVNPDAIIHEFVWCLTENSLQKKDINASENLWKYFSKDEKDYKYIYGRNWRSWPKLEKTFFKELDEIQERIVLENMNQKSIFFKGNFLGVITLYGFKEMGLIEKQVILNLYTSHKKLCCSVFQETSDVITNMQHNIAAYSLFTIVLAEICGIKPGKFVWKPNKIILQEINYPEITKILVSLPKNNPKLKVNSEIKKLNQIKYADFKIIHHVQN